MARKTKPTSDRPTLVDVAREAGVSAITVSRTIRSPEIVSERARQKVEEAIRRLGYTPDPAASALASRSTSTIGLLVPSLTNNVFSDVLRGVYEGVAGTRYFVQIGNYRYSALEEEGLIRNFLSQRPAGLIVSSMDQTPAGRKLLETAACPVVQIMETSDDAVDMSVGFDQLAGVRVAAQHLLDCGFRRPGFLSARMDPRAQRRLGAFRDFAAEAGVLDENRIITTPQPSSVGLGGHLLEQLLARMPDTDSVLCNNDDLAVGALMEATRRNIAVPGELGICSYNDIEMSRHMVPALTAVATPRHAIGRRAIDMLLAEIAKPNSVTERHVDLGYELMVRETTCRKA
ncbi:MAG: transcriptional regulator [Rhodobacteraceae bacterium]|jgi:LacI family gluconate utilization system Gnt-I transcriptional repressor|uniref:Transcriptional regulator, LacI family n=1 Tax=Salipiger profundus TaxID=1229727 RepID=A0A1U7D8L8_9RHOB|nr:MULTISPECIES: LacI family DNA-binding transcriptional regulator [Salipiger]APX24410.1 transcriptional regulator, LacI family [Salipiger profundus]MAB07287.1 transcriptional regulator [Paracoccaceae bacterium]GGA19776.1 LacI family transcriptional regulator [Salipiger profundus]SFD38032.1 transcriptional regulator, LacI family [Salipiger profundus]